MKKSSHSWTTSSSCLVVILGLIAGPMVVAGCSNPEGAVVKDTSTTKNKRTARIEQLKGAKPGTGLKKPGA